MSKLVKYGLIMGVLPVVLGVALHYFFEETNEVKKLMENIEQVYDKYSRPGQLTDFPVLGDPNAPVTIEVYSDFECPFCAQFANNIMPRLIADYVIPGKAKIVYKYFPLPSHPNARRAAYVAMCANTKGKFWHIHDKFYKNFTNLGDDEVLLQAAYEVGLTDDDFRQCFSDPSVLDSFLDKTFQDALNKGVRGTPTLTINGERFVGGDYSKIQKLIEKNL
ncbi:MAG: DsbA family protein [Chlorobi bacterium]|nr:DsbA family protein [Chlorobiota bacterium]